MNAQLTGRLLVASPTLLDPNFVRTVVMVLEHDESGALGVVLNRPSQTSLGTILAGWEDAADEPGVVFVGGPVQPDAAVGVGLEEQHHAVDEFQPITDDFGLVNLEHDPIVVVPKLAHLRVFAGYAGWGPGQLDEELQTDGWIVADALPGDVFDAEPDTLWRRVLARQPGTTRLLAHFPVHPSLN